MEGSLVGAFVSGEVLGHMLKVSTQRKIKQSSFVLKRKNKNKNKNKKVFADIDYASKTPRGVAQKHDQITRELQLFRAAGWPGDLDSKVLADNEPKYRRAILGWVWQIICYDQLNRFGGRQGSADNTNDIYRWVDRYLADHYDDVDPGDALKGLSAFQDGKLLTYLVHRTDPNAINLDGMYEDPVEEVTDRAINSAAKLGVPTLVDHEDIIGAPNDKSLVTYLTAFRDTVEKKDREIYQWVDKYLDGKYSDIPDGYAEKGPESFKDGRLLDYLVHKTDPDAIDLSAQREKQPRDRVNSSLDAAKDLLKISPRLNGDDVVKGNEEKLKRYLNQFRNALKDKEDADRRARAAAAAKAEDDERRRREAERKAAEEEEERRRREAERRAAEEEAERRRREAERRAAEEEAERRRKEAERRAAEEEADRRRRSAERRAAEEEEERRRREAARRAAEEEEERRRREAITGVRNIWPQQVLIAQLRECVIFPEFDSAADARQTRMYGPGLEHAKVGAPATFTIETRNRAGQPVRTGGHPFKLVVEGPGPGQDPEIQSIVDNEDGTFSAKYVPKASGTHTVRVTLLGENVAQSPVRVFAEPTDDGLERGLEDDLDDLRKILEAIAREIARDDRNLNKLPKIIKKLEQVGLTNEDARDLAQEVGEEDKPRLDDFLRHLVDAKDRAFNMLDNPRMTKSEIRKQLTPMIKQLVGNMDDWADDYGDVMDKIKNLKPSRKNGNQRQRVHLWIHRKGVPVPQHIMVTTNKPNTMNYRRHIRVDASKGFYDTHADPAGYLDGLLGLTSELKLQKIDSRDRYLTGTKDDDSELVADPTVDPDAYIVNDKGERVLPSKEALLIEGGLQNQKGQTVYGFLYGNLLAITQVVNNGEKYILRSIIKFDSVTPNYNGNPKSFLVASSKGKERWFTTKSKEVAAAWVSNISAAIRSKKGAF